MKGGGHPRTDQPTRCVRCTEVKPADEFDSLPAKRNGLSSHCKECRRALDRARPRNRQEWWRKQSKERLQRYRLKRDFNLTLEEYVAMREAQGGLCAICGQPERPIKKRHGVVLVQYLSVDHDHITGEIRGLLCDRCNRVLGWAQDQPALLERAAAYLRKPREVRITAS